MRGLTSYCIGPLGQWADWVTAVTRKKGDWAADTLKSHNMVGINLLRNMWLDSRETDRYLKVKFRPSSLLTYVSLLRLTVHVPTNTSDLRQLRPSSAELCVATQLIILKNILRQTRINRKGNKFRTSATVQTTLYPVSIPYYM
jgi:hypothetical protein